MSKIIKQAKKFGSSISDNIGDVLSGDIQGGLEGLLENTADFFTLGAYSKAKEIYELINQGTPEQTFEDRDRMATGNDTPRQFVYGHCRIGGQLVYWEPTGADSEQMHMIIVLAPHALESINEIYFNDELAFDAAGVAQGEFVDIATIYKVKDPRTTALPEPVANLTEWTENHILNGCSYLYTVLDYSRDAFSRGMPKISAVVQGKNDIYDPRTDTSGYTRNHALVTLDYITNNEGVRSELSECLLPSFIDGANVCDEQVAAETGTEPRYTVDGTLSFAATPLDNLVSLSKAGGASLNYDQGQWHYVAGTYSAPVLDFDESDLVGGLSFEAGASKANIINTAKGSYLDPTQNFDKVQYSPIAPSGYQALDGEELISEINAPFSTSSTNARRLAKLAIEKIRFGLRCQVTLKPRAMELISGDRITLTIARLGWNQKVFRVVDGGFSMSLANGVSLSLQEDAPSVWDWQEGDVEVLEPAAALILPDSTLAKPELLAVSEELYRTTTLADTKTRATFSWIAGGVRSNIFEVQTKKDGEDWRVIATDWRDNRIDINDIQTGLHEFRVRGISETGRSSDWASLSYTVQGKTAPPSDVSTITAAQKTDGIDIAWQPVTDLDVKLYEVRLDENFGQDGALYSGLQNSFSDGLRASGVTYYVRALDTSGNYSDMSAQFTPEITGPKKLASLISSSTYNNVFLQWSTGEAVYGIKTYRIRRGNDFESATVIGESSGTFEVVIENENGAFRYWVYAVDFAGNEGQPISTVANVDNPPDFILRDDDYIDFNQMDVLTNITIGQGGGGKRWDDTSIGWDDTELRWDDGPSLDLIGPVSTTESFYENMIRSGLQAPIPELSWDDTTQPWDDVALPWDSLGGDPYGKKAENGFTQWMEPALSSGFAERIIDLEAVIPSSRIAVTVETEDIRSGATVKTVLSTSLDGVAWTEFADDQLEINSADFQFLRVQLYFDSPSATGIIKVTSVRFKIDTKQKTDQGVASVLGADVDGTVIFLNKEFVDIESIVATPKAVDAKIAVATFEDVGNQDRFKVLVFDRATGARVDAQVSWNARGI